MLITSFIPFSEIFLKTTLFKQVGIQIVHTTNIYQRVAQEK